MENWKKMLKMAVVEMDDAMDDKNMSDEIYHKVRQIHEQLEDLLEELE